MAAAMLPDTVILTEVGPRDGLQNESGVISTDDKIRFIDALSAAGFLEIEVSSFVSPKWVPQLGDAQAVFEGITRREGTIYSALVPNMKGMERALDVHAAGQLDKIAVFTAASESFSQKNTNASIAETLDRFAPVIDAARTADMPIRGYVSCVIECPYDGRIDGRAVADVVRALLDLGVTEIDLGDTIGVAIPADIERLYDDLEGVIEPEETVLHLHDTRGTALACAWRALELGVHRFDVSCTGLGGCPYAPGASGNLATEDLLYVCDRADCHTGIDRERLYDAGRYISGVLERTPTARVFSADACPSTPASTRDGNA